MDELTTLQIKCNEIQFQVNNLSAKLDLINPALFLEFKGTVVETLKTFDRDIDNLGKDLALYKQQVDQVFDKRTIAIDKMIAEVKAEIQTMLKAQIKDHDRSLVTKTQIVVYGSLIGLITAVLFTELLRLFFK